MSPDPSALDPAQLSSRTFGTSFRGFDQDEVRAYLRRVSEAVEGLLAEQARLVEELTAAEERADAAPDLDEDQLTTALGEETARVLHSARHAAADIRAKAEENVARIVREAAEEAAATRAAADEEAAATRAELDELRRTADTELAARRSDADAYAVQVRGDADDAASTLRAESDAYALQVRTEADEAVAALRSDADSYAGRVRSDADEAAAATRSGADAYATEARAEIDAALAALRSDAEAGAERRTAAAEAEAARIIEQAELAAAAALTEAEDDARSIRLEAKGLLELRSAEAEVDAARIRGEADEALSQAGRDAELAVALAKDEGRELVAEAQRVRERTLKDLSRRRKAARGQLEQLRVARERLIEAYDVVRRTVDTATGELDVALPEARAAAVEAGRRTEAEAEATIEELEAEIEAARRSGSPLVEPEHEPVSGEPHDGDPDLDVALGPMPGAAGAEDLPDEGAADAGSIDLASGAAPEGEAPEADVDDLFARIRAAQEQPEVERVPEAQPEPEHGDDALVIDVTDNATAAADEDAASEPVPAIGADAVTAVDVTPDGTGDGTGSSEPNGTTVGAAAMLALLERRDGATDAVERRLARRLKRVMADEQNEVLDAVRRSRTVPGPDDVLPALTDHERSYAEAAADDLLAAAAAGAEFQREGFPDAATKASEPDVTDLSAALATELTQVVRPRIQRCFDDVEGDEEELTNRIRACYREWKTQRIVELTRHHVLAAFSRGQYDAVPEGTALQWVVDESGQPCPDAEDNALAGPVTKGDGFPTGHCLPPAHGGCRCMVVPAPR